MVRLIPMKEQDFQSFLEHDITRYAQDNVEAGYWAEAEALERSRKVHESLLPDGLATKNHHLYTIQDGNGNNVGVIWLRIDLDSPRPSGFIFNLEIDEPFRHKGFATEAMLQLEDLARGFGLQQLALHVFAQNKIARSLYEKLDYQVSSLNMIKKLAPS